MLSRRARACGSNESAVLEIIDIIVLCAAGARLIPILELSIQQPVLHRLGDMVLADRFGPG